MGDIWSFDKLTLFVAFVVPGFISMQIYRLFVAGDDSDLVKQLPAIVAYSALHYFVTGWLLLVTPEGWPRTIAAYFVVLLLPALWPPLILVIRDRKKWSGALWPPSILLATMLKPEATPWDSVFDNTQRFVRLKLKDGRFMGGFLAAGSRVSTYPCSEQIFIRNEHVVDQATGQFGEPIESTGLLVNGSEISYIELVEVELETD